MNMKCIIIDDEPVARKILQDFIEDIDYLELVGQADNPLKAMSLINDNDIDIIFLDINMPVMNGWEFLDEFKRLNIDPAGKCKIYIISSSVFSNDINKARSYPLVKDFISKPLNVEKIVELFKVEDPA